MEGRAPGTRKVSTSRAGVSGQVAARTPNRPALLIASWWQGSALLHSGSALIPRPGPAPFRVDAGPTTVMAPDQKEPHMSVLTATRDLQPDVQSATSRRVAAVAAALTGVALFMTVAVVNVPHKASSTELLTWWQQASNRMTGLLSGFFAIGVAVLLPIVVNHVQRLHATAQSPSWMSFARSMATAVTALWLVTGAARAAISYVVDVNDEPLPGLEVLRYATGLNYAILGLSGMAVLGLTMLAISVVVLRTGALARWVGYVGVVCAVITLIAVTTLYGAFATMLAILWCFALAVGIWRQPTTD